MYQPTIEKNALTTMTRKENIIKKIQEISGIVAPAWSLHNSVAVNPYWGLIDKKFHHALRENTLFHGESNFMPVSFYYSKYKKGEIHQEDIEKSLSQSLIKKEELLSLSEVYSDFENEKGKHHLSIADFIDKKEETNWRKIVESEISKWFTLYFDEGQASVNIFNKQETSSFFQEMKSVLEVDKTLYFKGLKKAQKLIKEIPLNHEDAIIFMSNYLFGEKNPS